MFREMVERLRGDRYDEAYERARARRIERERRKAEEFQALRVFSNSDADLTTGSLPVMRPE